MISSSCQGGNISNTTPNGAGEVIQPSWSCKTFPDWCCKHLHENPDSPSIKSFFLTKKNTQIMKKKIMKTLKTPWKIIPTWQLFEYLCVIHWSFSFSESPCSEAPVLWRMPMGTVRSHQKGASCRYGQMCSIEFQHRCIVTSCNITFQKLFQNPVLLHIQRFKDVFQTRIPK